MGLLRRNSERKWKPGLLGAGLAALVLAGVINSLPVSAKETVPAVSPVSIIPDASENSTPEEGYSWEMLKGKWVGCAAQSGQNYTMTLEFKEDGKVEYMAGWTQGEAAFLSEGTYMIDGKQLHMMFLHDQVSGQDINWNSIYEISLADETLEMSYLSGDSLNIFQEEGDIFTYKKEESSNDGFLTEEDKKNLREQLLVPESAEVEFETGTEYYWEAAQATVVPIAIYENGVLVAGADIDKETKELMTSIWTYQH